MSQELTTSKPKILLFCRNYLIPDFHQMFDSLSDEYELQFLTDQKCRYGTEDTRAAFYKYLNDSTRCQDLEQTDEDDVIARCRLMRNLERKQAGKMVHAMAQVICDVFDEKQPDLLFTHMTDEYIQHLFYILSKRKNIVYVSYCGSYCPGHALIFNNAYGSPLLFRQPEYIEVQEIFDQISPVEFRQNYNQVKHYTLRQHLRLMCRYYAKQVVFRIKAIIENDHWGMHYLIVPFCADRKRLSDFPSDSNFEHNWQNKLNALRKANPDKIILYFPLAYSPEATTDYWVNNKSIIDYENKVIEIIKILARDCIVLAKEHTHMMGARNVGLHEALKVLDSVISIHPQAIGNEVLLSADAVILGSGSVGVEAFLRDKPIFSYCDTSYWFKPSKSNYLDLDNISGWAEQIQKTLPKFSAANHEEKKQFIANCLKSTARTWPGGKRWPLIAREDLKLVMENLLTSNLSQAAKSG